MRHFEMFTQALSTVMTNNNPLFIQLPNTTITSINRNGKYNTPYRLFCSTYQPINKTTYYMLMTARFGKYALKGGMHLNCFLDFHFTKYLSDITLQEDSIFNFLTKLSSKFNMNAEEYCERLLSDLSTQKYSSHLSHFISSYFTWKWERVKENIVERDKFLSKLRKTLKAF